MSKPGQTLRTEYFDALYMADPDPWKFAVKSLRARQIRDHTRRDAEASLSFSP